MGATSNVSLLQLTMSRSTNTLLGDVEDQPVLDSELVEEKVESLRVLGYRTECSYRLEGLAHLRGLCYSVSLTETSSPTIFLWTKVFA